jgi:hypothetical protein
MSPVIKGDKLLSPPPKKLDAALATVLPTEDALLVFDVLLWVSA